MNMGKEQAESMGLADHLNKTKFFMEMVFGPCEMQACYDTLQYTDYKAHGNVLFDGEAKKQRHEKEFPKDLEQAFELGRRLALPLAGTE
jgi:hypothetical protein